MAKTKRPISARRPSTADMAQFILASASPRRKELLNRLELPFEIIPSSVEENYSNGMAPPEMAKRWALEKARDVAAAHPETIVVGADTIVVLEGKILGKPKDSSEAAAMLRKLSNKSHTVHTGVALVQKSNEAVISFVESTEVTFFELDETLISSYVATGSPLDKAGAYGIQDGSACFVEKVNGCYHNVVGFPVARFVQLVRSEEFKQQFSADIWFASDREIA